MRRLTGLVLAALALATGAFGFLADESWWAFAAGCVGLVAGVLLTTADQRVAIAEQSEQRVRGEIDALRQQGAVATAELVEERRQHDNTRQTLADLMSAQPPAGSFDRKFDATGPVPVTPGSGSPTDTRILADPETNLFSEAYFRVALDARIASARRHLRPVAIALMEVVEGLGTTGLRPGDPTKMTGAIRQTLRDADTACRMADGCFALILEDTPENGAVWTVERIRRNLTSRHGHHTLWAGVACYPAHAFSTDELLDQASLALDSAREWKQDRIEVATAD